MSSAPDQISRTPEQSLLYVVSHDFGAPIRHVNSFAGLLLDKHRSDLDDESTQWLNTIVQASTLAQEMLQGLLELSRITPESVAAAPVLLSSVLARVDQDSHVLELAGDCHVTADVRLLARCFAALAANVVDHTDAKVLHVRAVDRRGRVDVCAWDDGTGLDEVTFERMLQPFARVVGRPEVGAIGVGLTVAARIVAALGGELIWLAPGSECDGVVTGVGLGLRFSLPAAG